MIRLIMPVRNFDVQSGGSRLSAGNDFCFAKFLPWPPHLSYSSAAWLSCGLSERPGTCVSGYLVCASARTKRDFFARKVGVFQWDIELAENAA